MHNFKRSTLQTLLLLPLLGISGCSYAYDLRIEGLLLSGVDQSPIAQATITLFAGAMDYATTTSDKEGRWVLTDSISDTKFDADHTGKRWLKGNRRFPHTIRIEVDDETFTLPCPKVAAPESGKDIFASVLAVLNLDAGDGHELTDELEAARAELEGE